MPTIPITSTNCRWRIWRKTASTTATGILSVLLSEPRVVVRSMKTRRRTRSWTRMSGIPNFSRESGIAGEKAGRSAALVVALILTIYRKTGFG